MGFRVLDSEGPHVKHNQINISAFSPSPVFRYEGVALASFMGEGSYHPLLLSEVT